MDGSGTRQDRAGIVVTLVGVVVNLFMIALKFAGGYYGHSQALIADAVHSISDLFTDAVALLGLMAGRKRPDSGHPFGHARIETLASALVGGILLAVAIYLGAEAARNIYHHTEMHPRGRPWGWPFWRSY